MANLWRGVEIEWKGETYSLDINFALLASIEREGDLSILEVARGARKGKPQTTLMAFIVFKVLIAAGVKKVTLDEIGAGIMGADKGETAALYHVVMDAMAPIPFEYDEGNEASDVAA